MFASKFQKARCLSIALFLCLIASAPAAAHPHVWIDMRTDLVMSDNNQLSAIEITWTFDEFYTAFAVEEFKKRGDGTYAPADLDALLKINLEHLKEWTYFTELKQAGASVPFAEPRPLRATYDAKLGQLTIAFALPLATPVSPTKAAPITLRIFDPTYYISIDYVKENPLRITGAAHPGCAINRDTPDLESTWASLPESAFSGGNMGGNFAANVSLTCPEI